MELKNNQQLENNFNILCGLREKTIVVGGDHHAHELAKIAYQHLKEIGFKTEIVNYNEEYYDYIHQAIFVAKKVSSNPERYCGIIGCRNGFGVTTVCNKYPFVFANRCDTVEEAINARKVNYSNVLAFGKTFVNENSIKQIINAWLETEFDLNDKNTGRLKRLFELEKEIRNNTHNLE